MEFQFDVSSIFHSNVCVVDKNLKPKNVQKIEKINNAKSSIESKICEKHLSEIINVMGQASAQAQNLQDAITTEEKLRYSDHRLYIMIDEHDNDEKGIVIGILKVGYKHLFVFNRGGNRFECSPLCILDFYVHESKQRKGYGHVLFENMLKEEKVYPCHMAIDKPSAKLLTFLKKFYSLHDPIHQTNHFVVFDEFFINNPVLFKSICEQRQEKEFIKERKSQVMVAESKQFFSNSEIQKNIDKSIPKSNKDYSCFSNSLQKKQGNASLHNKIKSEFYSPIKLSAYQDHQGNNSLYNSSSWKVLGVPPPSYSGLTPVTNKRTENI